MKTQKYDVNQQRIETVLAWVNSGEIAIPEIQRPFVWDSTKVRDLMDSLYQGYPIGYLIAWRNPNVKLKDGSTSEGKKVLIDGQQRVTALTAAILNKYVIDKHYKRIKIQIAFNPLQERFEVFNPAIAKDHNWLPDISKVISGDVDVFELVEEYCGKNKDTDRKLIFQKIEALRKITQKQIGLIELDSDLDIETVTEVFIRINSKGVVLSQADFAMSKIAANEEYNGPTLRKCIDYFCHLAIAPEFYPTIIDVDKEFAKTDYFQKMSWLKNENDDLYDPNYNDLLRVSFTSEFNRGKLADLVSLLSGRNFESRTFEEEIARESFEKLEKGVLNFINETNFKRFIMIVKSAGFIVSHLVRSQNVLNFAYVVYLKLRSMKYNPADIETYVRRWIVMSILTSRYSSSPESAFDYDIKQISNMDFKEYLANIESAELSDAFWDAALVQHLNTSVASSPYFHVFLASQVKMNDKGFLSKDITVKDLISHRGDIHHIFPRDYMKKNGLKRGQYNQISNYVYMQSEINIKIGNKAPIEYFSELSEQCNGGELKYGGLTSMDELKSNMDINAIPEEVMEMDVKGYDDFLEKRRKLIAGKIKDYYLSL
ncbi:MAG: DUF262 domain-containing protein [Deltaproteobacteria bacterium]|nr:DUF262 domain-containing protein [Deltaproteobacteria bacterium]